MIITLFLHLENGRDRVTLTASDVRVKAGSSGFLAKNCNLDPFFEERPKGASHLRVQLHEFTGIGTRDLRNWAVGTQGWLPGGAQQPAFFVVASPVVITVKVLAFLASRGSHASLEFLDLAAVRSPRAKRGSRTNRLGYRRGSCRLP
jgi:hypothetical protein